MDNEQAVKLAKALGLVEQTNYQGLQYYKREAVNGKGELCYEYICEKEDIADYLNSPEGREAVRDRVEELWCVHKYRAVAWWTQGGTHWAELVSDPKTKIQVIAEVGMSPGCAALLWLDERGE